MDVSLLGAVKHSPLFFLLALMLSAPAFPVALVSLVMMMRKAPIARLIGLVAVGGALVALLVSVAGWLYGRQLIELAAASPGLNEAEKALLLQMGYREALYNIWFGLVVTLPSIVLGGIAILGSKSKP